MQFQFITEKWYIHICKMILGSMTTATYITKKEFETKKGCDLRLILKFYHVLWLLRCKQGHIWRSQQDKIMFIYKILFLLSERNLLWSLYDVNIW